MTSETPSSGGSAPRPAFRGPRRDDRSGGGDRGDRRYGGGGDRGGGGRRPRRKVCSFCVDKVKRIDYKEVGRIRRYISERGKIDPRRKSGTCAKHQRMLTTALKRARHMALLPYTAEHVRAMMSPQARAMAGGPPPPKPDRPPYRPQYQGGFRPAGPGPATGSPPASGGGGPVPAPQASQAVALPRAAPAEPTT